MSAHQLLRNGYVSLSTYDEAGTLNVVIETPQGRRNKYRYDVPECAWS